VTETEYRIEHDTMGEVRVPKDALYAAQTQRAVENFPISGDPLDPAQIVALARIKKAAALANKHLGSPDVNIALGAQIKKPGDKMLAEPTELKVVNHPGGEEMDAYERLLGDAMRGDGTLFARQDGVEAAWAIVQPILSGETPIHLYEKGTWGPSQAAQLADPVGGWSCPPG